MDPLERAVSELAGTQAREPAAVRTMLDRYGLPDPTSGRNPGEFADSGVRAQDDRMPAEGLRDRRTAPAVSAGLAGDAVSTLVKARVSHPHPGGGCPWPR